MTIAKKKFLKLTLICAAFGAWGVFVSITSFMYLDRAFPRNSFLEDKGKEDANGRFIDSSVIWGTEYDNRADDFGFGNFRAVVIYDNEIGYRPIDDGEFYKAAEPTLPRGYDGEVDVNGVGVFTVTNGMDVGNAAYIDNGGWFAPVGPKTDEEKSTETP